MTKPCWYYKRGKCKFGENCKNSHETVSARGSAERTERIVAGVVTVVPLIKNGTEAFMEMANYLWGKGNESVIKSIIYASDDLETLGFKNRTTQRPTKQEIIKSYLR